MPTAPEFIRVNGHVYRKATLPFMRMPQTSPSRSPHKMAPVYQPPARDPQQVRQAYETLINELDNFTQVMELLHNNQNEVFSKLTTLSSGKSIFTDAAADAVQKGFKHLFIAIDSLKHAKKDLRRTYGRESDKAPAASPTVHLPERKPQKLMMGSNQP